MSSRPGGSRSDFVQCNNSLSRFKGTLRGLHYQIPPHAEAKLVRCVSGRIFDVIVDMRPDSSTGARWFGAELTAENRSLVYVPEGCAHGYLSLEDKSEVIYMATAPYAADAERGVRWNDPGIGISWPIRTADSLREGPSVAGRDLMTSRGRVLVTGATGCVGHFALPKLVRNGWDVRAVRSRARRARDRRCHMGAGESPQPGRRAAESWRKVSRRICCTSPGTSLLASGRRRPEISTGSGPVWISSPHSGTPEACARYQRDPVSSTTGTMVTVPKIAHRSQRGRSTVPASTHCNCLTSAMSSVEDLPAHGAASFSCTVRWNTRIDSWLQ
jgi:dTDP-4-dehydrorhamnose 3,5-epimerase